MIKVDGPHDNGRLVKVVKHLKSFGDWQNFATAQSMSLLKECVWYGCKYANILFHHPFQYL
jgi:hypothetical protein